MSAYAEEQIRSRVIQTLSDVSGVEPSELLGHTTLVADLNLDSLALYEVVIDLEEAFHTQISDEEIDRIKIIDDIVAFIKRKTGSGT